MRVRTYLEWCKLSTFIRDKHAIYTIVDNWSYELVEGDYNVYVTNKMHLMTFENRLTFNLKLMYHYLNEQMFKNYEKRQTAHL